MNSKTTMLAAVLVVAVVALAGAGYAAVTQYTASTQNTGNGLNSSYMTLTQGGGGAYSTNFFTGMYFNSVNTVDANTIVYTPVFDCAIDDTTNEIDFEAGSPTMAKVSNILTLTVTPENVNQSAFAMTVDVTNFTPVEGLTYLMVFATKDANDAYSVVWRSEIVGTANSVAGNHTWSSEAGTPPVANTINFAKDNNNKPTETTIYAMLFISGSCTGTMDAHAGFLPVPANANASANVFTFTAIASVGNA